MKKMIPTKISPDLLDTIGRSFKFRHAKGVAEWLKNSLDSYLRLRAAGEESLDGRWPVLIELMDGGRKPGPNLAVVDFGGTDYGVVKDFFLHWGDTSAATHGGHVSSDSLTGGHGNGGKFYMREMWTRGARFLTWRCGKCTSLVVNKSIEKGKTGYWEMEDEEMPRWRDALEFALPIAEKWAWNSYLQRLTDHGAAIEEELASGRRGLTVVVGFSGEQVWSSNDVVHGKKWNAQKLIDEIVRTNQATRPIRELSITVAVNGTLKLEKMELEKVDLDPDFQTRRFDLQGTEIGLASEKIGQLTIRKSASQLKGLHKQMNGIAISDGKRNPIAFHPMDELPIKASAFTAFFFGDLSLTFHGIGDITSNDRERLVPSPVADAISSWLGAKITEVVGELEDEQKQTKLDEALSDASAINDLLNKHAESFLEKFESEILVDYLEDLDGGGFGDEGTGEGGRESDKRDDIGITEIPDLPDAAGEKEFIETSVPDVAPDADGQPVELDSAGVGGDVGKHGTKEQPGSTRSKRRPRFPRVLLSGHHSDPTNPEGNTKTLSRMHPPLYQDDTDRLANVWWINTAHPFAEIAIKQTGGAQSPSFRSYHLFMFRDMVQRETMRLLQKREAEIEVDRLETELDEISNQFLAELPYSLVQSLVEGQKAA